MFYKNKPPLSFYSTIVYNGYKQESKQTFLVYQRDIIVNFFLKL